MSRPDSSPFPTTLLTSLHKDGYVLIPSLVPTAELTRLRTAVHDTVSYTLSGSWPYVRTLPRQFPPWPLISPSPLSPHLKIGIWGIQHLLHPLLPLHAIFAQLYFSLAILDIAKALLAPCTDDDLVMELCNLLIVPTSTTGPAQNFTLRWHRDDIPWSATTEEETARLAPQQQQYLPPQQHAQYNIALYDDESLIVVPGSHVRARTEVEREAGKCDEENMPGQVTVKLKAGDAVFYDNNILHRGIYVAGMERATVHGSVGHVRAGAGRARNVLQHGVVEWVGECDLEVLGSPGTEERERAEGMRRRLVALGESCGGEKEVGYSLEG